MLQFLGGTVTKLSLGNTVVVNIPHRNYSTIFYGSFCKVPGGWGVNSHVYRRRFQNYLFSVRKLFQFQTEIFRKSSENHFYENKTKNDVIN